MNRKLKAFGVALVGSLALAAMAAPGAQANEGIFIGSDPSTGEHVPTLVRGVQSPEDPLVFTSGGSSVSCSEGEITAVIPEGTAEQFPMEFGFSAECQAGGSPATVFPNGCYLALQTSETAVEGSFTGVADLECPNGPAQIKVYGGASHGFTICTISIAAQEGLEGAVVHNRESEPADLEVTLNAEGLLVSQSGLCGNQESSATLEGSAIVGGTNEAEEPVDIRIQHVE